MILAYIIMIGLPLLFFIWMMVECFKESDGGYAILGFVATPIAFLVSALIAFIITGLGGSLVAECGAPIMATSTKVQELVPMNKNYYIAIDPDGEDSTKYRYAIPNEDGSFTIKETCGENSIKFTFIDVNDKNADLIPSVTITKKKFKNSVLAFCFTVPDEYSFNIYEDSMLNVGIPVI